MKLAISIDKGHSLDAVIIEDAKMINCVDKNTVIVTYRDPVTTELMDVTIKHVLMIYDYDFIMNEVVKNAD